MLTTAAVRGSSYWPETAGVKAQTIHKEFTLNISQVQNWKSPTTLE